ncbi:MAG: hypothetical protein Q8Q10_03140 [bacterium]|nr:hypothetical protein [bacterium]
MAGEDYYSGGIRRFDREGSSLQEQAIHFPARGFQEKLEQLRTGDAIEIARKYKFGRIVTEYLKDHAIEDLDETECKEFLRVNPDFKDYHPALVRAVAEEIEVDKRAQEAHESAKH